MIVFLLKIKHRFRKWYLHSSCFNAPTRAADFDSSSDASPGSFVFVEQGTTNGDNGFVLTNNSVTLGTTALVFVQFSGAGQITAGTGLTKNGNTINAVAGDGLDVAADEISVDLKANGESYN